MRRRVCLLCALALLAPAAARGLTSDPVGVAAQKISAGETVYVDPSAEARLTPGQAAAVRRAIQRDAGGQMYVAVLPASAAAAGGAGAAADRFRAGVGFPGVYVLVAGRDLQAAGTDVDGGPLATAAVQAHRADGLPAILEDLAQRVGDARKGVTEHSFGAAGWIAPLAVLLGGAAFASVVVRRRRRTQRAALASVHGDVGDEVAALGEDVDALAGEVAMPEARDHLAAAAAARERADGILERARRPEDLAGVGRALEEGRWALAACRAALDGEPEPERRSPCFFDPRHGPSVRDVEWAPPGGPRMVPACAADSRRIEEGDEPQFREFATAGGRVAWFEAGPAYTPFIEGWMNEWDGWDL